MSSSQLLGASQLWDSKQSVLDKPCIESCKQSSLLSGRSSCRGMHGDEAGVEMLCHQTPNTIILCTASDHRSICIGYRQKDWCGWASKLADFWARVHRWRPRDDTFGVRPDLGAVTTDEWDFQNPRSPDHSLQVDPSSCNHAIYCSMGWSPPSIAESNPGLSLFNRASATIFTRNSSKVSFLALQALLEH